MGSSEPSTAAVRMLREHEVAYRPFQFDYRRYPGASGAAEALNVDVHVVIKTIVMETNSGRGALVLMNGDKEVSTKALARLMSVKSTKTASERRARRLTGYEFGGTSPFGTRKSLPTYAHADLAAMDEILINGGSRGFLVAMSVADMTRILDPEFGDISM